MITQPMLAVQVKDYSKIKYPVLGTPKLDGIRCLVIKDDSLSRKGQPLAVTRQFKPIPNEYVREVLQRTFPIGFDGELMPPTRDDSFNAVTRAIMKYKGTPNFVYNVFDFVLEGTTKPYVERMNDLRDISLRMLDHSSPTPHFLALLPKVLHNEEELKEYEEWCVNNGYEGAMIRTPDSPYKLGRSTENEGYLLKIKRFVDSEAEIIGFEEQLHNNNELTHDAFGRAERASCKENLIPTGVLGSFIVKDTKTGAEFKIGTGMTAAFRKYVWDHKEEFIHQIGVYKSQPYGVKDLPRFPVWKGLRHPADL